MSRGLKNMLRRNGKVLAQHGHAHRRAGGFQVCQAALEKGFVGEHGNCRRTARFVSRRDPRRGEIGREQTLAGRGLFHFGDDGGRAPDERGTEIPARRGVCLGATLPVWGREHARG